MLNQQVNCKLFLFYLNLGFAGDYVKAMWLMLQHEKPDDFVIATGKTYSVQEFLETTFNLAGLDYKKYVEIDERLFRPHEVPLLLGDPQKAKQILKWVPETDFNQLVEMMYKSDLEKLK